MNDGMFAESHALLDMNDMTVKVLKVLKVSKEF